MVRSREEFFYPYKNLKPLPSPGNGFPLFNEIVKSKQVLKHPVRFGTNQML